MTAAQAMVLQIMEDTEEDTNSIADYLMYFGYDGLEKGNYQDLVNKNSGHKPSRA